MHMLRKDFTFSSNIPRYSYLAGMYFTVNRNFKLQGLPDVYLAT